jgi:oxygen-independent coproporphyrinogen III oxidase
MDQTIRKYLDARLPRYTSYPTAPQFSAAVGPADLRQWLGALPADARLSLYLHIPFCRQMCWYCGCNMKLAARYEPVRAYVDRLLGEIDLVAKALSGRRRVGHIHWGGGTPTTLLPEDFARLDAALRKRFGIASAAEIAVEIDPRTLTGDRVEAIARMGCNRASLGVQEFDPGVQQAINRIQPFETVAGVVDWLRGVGIGAINFDLMYGLPHQTVDKLLETVRRAAELKPSRIALFGYAHVPWMAKNQRLIESDALPDAVARFEMSEAAGDLIESLGYRRIGIDHFALPGDSLAEAARDGRLRPNFQGYTADDGNALIGLGASAISALPQGYAQNIVETGAYLRAIDSGGLPVAKGLRLTGDDRFRRAIIERLMCDMVVDLGEISRRFGLPLSELGGALDLIAGYAAEGLVRYEGGIVTITPSARPLARLIASAFDAFLQPETAQQRHARL